MNDTCRTCSFWRSIDRDKLGHCRFGPPIVAVIDNASQSVWPKTTALDWCGMFNRMDGRVAAAAQPDPGVREFINSCCVVDDGARVEPTPLLERWQDWCSDNERTPGTAKAFFLGVKAAGFRAGQSNNRRFYQGLKLAADGPF